MQLFFRLPCVSKRDDIDTVDRDSRGAHNHDGSGNYRSAEALCPERLQLVSLPTTEQQQTFDNCALTMSSPWDHDDRAFFNENIRRLEQQFALAGLLFVQKQNEHYPDPESLCHSFLLPFPRSSQHLHLETQTNFAQAQQTDEHNPNPKPFFQSSLFPFPRFPQHIHLCEK